MCDEMYNMDRSSPLEVVIDPWPLRVQNLFVFPKGPSSFTLISCMAGGKEGCGGIGGFQPKARRLLRAWNLICPLLLHPSRLLAFTPDPVTPSSGLQQQQKEEIREIDRLEGITVAFFISACAHSWHSLLVVLQLNLCAVCFLACVLMFAVVCTYN